MSKKDNKTPFEHKAHVNVKEKPKMSRKKKITIIVISSLILASLIVTFIVGLVAVINKTRQVDYMSDDLSKYIYISSDDYKNYPVDVPLLSVDESDVQREIRNLLVKNKDKNALFGGAAVHKPDYAITLGDVVDVWYRAYTTDKNGVKTELAGACNFGDGKAYALEIGSGNFIKGIEEGLIGKYLQEESVKIAKNGHVLPGDVLYISYNAFLEDGSTESVSEVRIDTSNRSELDKKYGLGFANFFIGKAIGELAASNETFRVPGESLDRVYYDIKIDYAVRIDEEPFVIDVVFPADYHEISYRGLKATFEVYASTAVIYNTQEWNDTFITETLKITADSLAEYEGETLTDKYENKLLSELKASAEEKNKSLIEEKMWENYHAKVKVKKLPKVEVDAIYRQYFSEVETQYAAYGAGYDSFDAFARYYFGLSSLDNWRAYITERAEKAVTERLIFYYIIDKEGIVPSNEEYDSMYAEYKNEYMEYYVDLYKTELDACKTDAEREAKLLEIEEEMLEYYGEEYFRELVYYQYALDRLIGYAALK